MFTSPLRNGTVLIASHSTRKSIVVVSIASVAGGSPLLGKASGPKYTRRRAVFFVVVLVLVLVIFLVVIVVVVVVVVILILIVVLLIVVVVVAFHRCQYEYFPLRLRGKSAYQMHKGPTGRATRALVEASEVAASRKPLLCLLRSLSSL